MLRLSLTPVLLRASQMLLRLSLTLLLLSQTMQRLSLMLLRLSPALPLMLPLPQGRPRLQATAGRQSGVLPMASR